MAAVQESDAVDGSVAPEDKWLQVKRSGDLAEELENDAIGLDEQAERAIGAADIDRLRTASASARLWAAYFRRQEKREKGTA